MSKAIEAKLVGKAIIEAKLVGKARGGNVSEIVHDKLYKLYRIKYAIVRFLLIASFICSQSVSGK